MFRSLAAFAAVALLTCAPALAQDVRTLPAAGTLTGAEKLPAVQGTGCPTKTTPCATVAVTPAQVATFLAPTFQAKDPDLDAIAALSTASYGRSLLTQADAAATRSALGLGSLATQSAPLAIASGGTGRTVARPALIAARSAANFSTGFQSIGQSFATVQVNAASVDTAAGFSASTFLYTVPETGIYLVTGRYRLVDGTAAGINCAIGVDVAAGDTIGLTWQSTIAASPTGSQRNVLQVSRIVSLTAGQTLRLFAFADTSGSVAITAAELSAQRL